MVFACAQERTGGETCFAEGGRRGEKKLFPKTPMISRRERLPRGELFRGKGAGTITTTCFFVKYKPNGTGTRRLGVIIGAKVEPSAARRHFWKRRIYSGAKILVPPGQDALFVAKPEIKNLTARLLLAELRTIARRIPTL